jgi:methylated-DNA-protein-cysteine methyltransferase-like protein
VAGSSWAQRVAEVVSAIPRGQTASYAQVALWAGKPGAARAVAQALHALDDAPWWRVVKSDGTVAAAMLATQGPRLRREGVALDGRRVLRGAGRASRGRQNSATSGAAGS